MRLNSGIIHDRIYASTQVVDALCDFIISLCKIGYVPKNIAGMLRSQIRYSLFKFFLITPSDYNFGTCRDTFLCDCKSNT